jgi:hypothetical protein
MKKHFTTLLIVFMTHIAVSQNWQWAKQLNGTGGYGSEGISSLITDGSNYYAIGHYGEELNMTTDTLYANGVNDIYILKYDNTGNLLWAKTIGGYFTQPSASENAWGVYDPTNSCIYIAGQFLNTINFGGSLSLTAYGSFNTDIFLAKMDLNGNFIWAVKGGGWGADEGKIFLSPNNTIYLVTQTSDSSYFGSYHLGSGGGIVQYDTNGNCLNAELKFTAPVFNNQNGVYLEFINNDLVIYGTIKSDTFQLDTATIYRQGGSDAFIAKADANANIYWIKRFGNMGLDYIPYRALSKDNANNLYFTGGFKDSIDFGGNILYNTNQDIFIAKLNSNGGLIWNKQMFANGGTTQGGSSIICDGDGNCYITGVFQGSALFDTYNISAIASSDMFLARYDMNGNCMAVRNFGQAIGQTITVGNNNEVVCGGLFLNTINIAGNTFTANGYDVYVAKIDQFTGIGEGNGRMANNQLLIYANPNAGKCNITVPDDFLNEKNLTLSIYDNTGKLIQQQTLEMNEGKIKINLEQEAKGIYNVTLSSKKKSYNGKIVFE